MSQKRNIASIVGNSIIVLLEIFGLSEVFFRYLPDTEPFPWYLSLTYYTNLSNILLFVGSFLMLIQGVKTLKGKDSPRFLYLMKYLGVITTAITFLTIYFIVITTQETTYAINIHGNMWLLMHTICPLLGVLSFYLTDKQRHLSWLDSLYSIVFTLLYTLMVIILFLTGAPVPYASALEGGQESLTLPSLLLIAIPDNVLCIALSFFFIFLNHRMEKHREKKKSLTE